ncbi:MAG: HEPN domain-containing protein [Chloroflexota bacterium]
MTPADPSDPQVWLRRAYSNLHLAEKGRGKDVMLEDLCFNAQQAAEKALKAACLFKGLDFPKTHSLVRLMDILESSDATIPETVKSADILTQYAVQARYPGPVEEITAEEYKTALTLASQVVFWVESFISKR